MKVRELYISDVAAITREASLAKAGSLMKRHGVDVLPVVDRADRVIGIVTDRDCFIEIARREALPSELSVEDVMIERPEVSLDNDDVLDCLAIMRRERVRRLPVVDQDERLVGIVSIDDILCRVAQGQNGRELPAREVLESFCEIVQEDHRDIPPRSASRIPAQELRVRAPAAREREGSIPSRSSGRRDRSLSSR